MENDKHCPNLVSCKILNSEFAHLRTIPLASEDFTVGRGRQNAAIIPFISISRNHCSFHKMDNDWYIKDNSSLGVEINDCRLGKGSSTKLAHDDIIVLEPSAEFVYRFVLPSNDEYVVPKKRIKLENDSQGNNIINDVKIKFEESQTYEIKHIEERIQNVKQMQTTSMNLKQQLQLDLNRKLHQLETDFALQIENLKGEKNLIEKQKALLIKERDVQLALVKEEMEGKIMELMSQIKKHHGTESELITENNLLKEKLLKEREEFLSELNRESSSYQDLLEKLEGKMKEQEEIQIRDKQELEEMLRKETEQLRMTKEKELKELEEQKKQRELELQQELDNIKKNLQEQVQQTQFQKLEAERQLNEKMEEMKKLSDKEKVKMTQLMHERSDMRKLFQKTQADAQKSLEELRRRVSEREVELAALAAQRIQQQADQSNGVIQSLQEQLETVKKQLQKVETEKKNLGNTVGEGSSKQSTLTEVGELMESELQCIICAELFVEATTLNCSHTFCKYCITMWMKKKKDCPICRSPIKSQCRSLVLDSFIEKMVQNLTEEMKLKRQDLLSAREELQSNQLSTAETSRRSDSYDDENSDPEDSEFDFLDEEEEEEGQFDSQDYYNTWPHRWQQFYNVSTDSGSDSDTDDHDRSSTHTVAGSGDSSATDGAGASGLSSTENEPRGGGGAVRRSARVRRRSSARYWGNGPCFRCGASGHRPPGCPL